MIRVSVQHEPIDIVTELSAIENMGAGAVATFAGHVRADDGVTGLELEHYPGMTDAALTALAVAAAARWTLLAVSIVHRVGQMTIGDRIVWIATAAPHRGDALAACAALIDQLKTNTPFWKNELRGSKRRWVEHRAADETAARRWD